MRRFRALLGLAAAGLFLVGCATTKVDWNSRVAQYSYDEAVTELGVPDRQATLSDGTVVAEWLERRGGTYGTGYSLWGSSFNTYDVHEFPDRYLRLTFGPDRKLSKAGNFSR